MKDYLPGADFGLPDSVLVHKWANIAGELVCGEHCRIDAFVTITGRVKLGNRVHIGTGVCIFGMAGVEIGDGCSISPGVKIFTGTDDVHSDALACPCLENPNGIYGAVRIGTLTAIGANVVILPATMIGEEVQIAANAVMKVGARIPSNQVWGGLPAHYICPRAKVDRALMLGYVEA